MHVDDDDDDDDDVVMLTMIMVIVLYLLLLIMLLPDLFHLILDKRLLLYIVELIDLHSTWLLLMLNEKIDFDQKETIDDTYLENE